MRLTLLGSPPYPKLLNRRSSNSKPVWVGECISRVYSRRRGPLPRLTMLSQVPGLPVKSVMRPPNSPDCLTIQFEVVSPGLCSVVTQVASTSDLRAESTATPSTGWRDSSVFWAAGVGLGAGFWAGAVCAVCAFAAGGGACAPSVSLGACANSAGANRPMPAKTRRGSHVPRVCSFLFISSPLRLRLEESTVRVGTMNRCVTHGASLVFLGLVVE